jgi:hypothetical protein
VIQFDINEEEVEKALGEKLHIISLDSSTGASRDDVLAQFLEEIQRELDTLGATRLRDSRPDVFEELELEVVQKAVQTPQQSAIIETTSRLCFVMMPFSKKFDDVYRLLIAPVATENGLSVLRADEMSGPGFIMEQIRTAVQQSRLCIADVTGSNPNVLYEIGYAEALGKPLIILSEDLSHLPFDVAHRRVVGYGKNLESAREALQRAITVEMSTGRLEVAARRFDMGEYGEAIATCIIVLDQRLREALAAGSPEDLSRMTLGRLLDLACTRELVKEPLATRLRHVVALRNQAMHGKWERLTKKDAQLVLDAVREVLAVLPRLR